MKFIIPPKGFSLLVLFVALTTPGWGGGWQEFRPHLTEEEKEEPRVITLVEAAGEPSSQVWDFLVCIAIASSLAGRRGVGVGGLR